MLELKKLVRRDCLVAISPRSRSSLNCSLPMMLICWTRDFAPFDDRIDDIDAVLVELDHLRLDGRGDSGLGGDTAR